MAILRVEEIRTWPGSVALREADRVECEAQGYSEKEGLDISLDRSLSAYVALVGGEPIAFWGYLPESLLGRRAYAWMLTTELAESYPVLLGCGSKKILSGLLELYPEIFVTVDPKHALAVSWLTWLGFVFDCFDGACWQMRKSRWAL